MAITHPLDETTHASSREPFLHIVARDFQWVLRGLCLLLLAATVIFMMTFWPAAIATVIMLLLCYIALVIADGVEHRTDIAPHEEEPAGGPAATSPADAVTELNSKRKQARTVAIERRLTRISLEVLGASIVLAATMAGVAFGWKILPIAGLVVLGYIILVTAPVWGAWMESDVQDEVMRHRVD
jgi:hypothetical protein